MSIRHFTRIAGSKPYFAACFVALALTTTPNVATAGVYAYSEIGASDGGSVAYIWGTGVAISDDPTPGVGAWVVLSDPNSTDLTNNSDVNSSGWDVVVFGDEVTITLSSVLGTYQAVAGGWTPYSTYTGCSPPAQVQISHFNHHYDFTNMGNPNTYTLNADSQGRRCAHTTLTWDPTSLSGLTDDGLLLHFGVTPVACLSQCTAGKTGAVTGPLGTVSGPAACG